MPIVRYIIATTQTLGPLARKFFTPLSIIFLHGQLPPLRILPLHPLRRLPLPLVIRLLHVVPIRAQTRAPRRLHRLHHGAPRVLVGVFVNLLEQGVQGLVALGLFSRLGLGEVAIDGVPVAVGGVGSVFVGGGGDGFGVGVVYAGNGGRRRGLLLGISFRRRVFLRLLFRLVAATAPLGAAFVRPALLPIPALALIQQLAPFHLALLLLQLDQNLLLLDDRPTLLRHHLLVQITANHRVLHEGTRDRIVLFNPDGDFVGGEDGREIFGSDVGFEDLHFHEVVVLVVLVFGHAGHDAAVDGARFSGGGGGVARLSRGGVGMGARG
mmetsp:Transcript_7770/g.11682  ORF Transcript_7770/g.11682 Transcript_7770/m.11682 type:complete len:324 (-) Transcript_7770:348-1319(-)